MMPSPTLGRYSPPTASPTSARYVGIAAAVGKYSAILAGHMKETLVEYEGVI
jgi:hypothetical protein